MRFGPFVSVAILAAATNAHAAEPRMFRVDVSLPNECGDTFEGDLRAKLRNVELVRSGTGATSASTLRVRAEKIGARAWRGTLDIEASGSAAVQRTLEAESCGELLRGLTLIAAVTIDPPAAPPETAPETPATAPEPSSPSPPSPPPTPPAERAPPPAATSRWSVAVGGTTEVSSLAPDPTALFGGFAELALRDHGPRARLRVGSSLPVDTTRGANNASLSWLVGGVEVCPLGLALGGSLTLRPCAGMTIGSFAAEGTGLGLSAGQSRDRLWAAGRIATGLDADLGIFTFAVSGGAIVPITRDQLVFQAPAGTAAAAAPVYRAPSFAAFGCADVGVRFW
jgi:hypothetical protein